MDLKGKKILVVGLGITGEAVCHFLLDQGARVTVSEQKTKEQLGQKGLYWEEKGVTLETGQHDLRSFLAADLIVPSPGVPLLSEIKEAQSRGVDILSEIELAYVFLKGKIVGITGSNGKSTTASLTHKILLEGGMPSFLAGNIGTPLISLVNDSRNGNVYVTEISSFQLQYIKQFKASISVLLNISPDHLDWHPSFSHYTNAKTKIVSFQDKEAKSILNRDDPLVWDLRTQTESRVYAFSRNDRVHPGCFIEEDWFVLTNDKEQKVMKTTEVPLFGIHNQENVMAAVLVGHLFLLPPEQIRESIQKFEGLEHRLEKVTTIDGVDFYNDSKATNVEASLKSILSFTRPIILIAGGRDKGGDFARLKESVEQRVKKLILIGEAADKLAAALEGAAPINEASTLEEAVNKSFSHATPGDVVLLAPACTSFDMFQNFEERGKDFKDMIFQLKKKRKKRY
jgi:UDP-N-acetylmuramoylalanine--D-glutamate ligase